MDSGSLVRGSRVQRGNLRRAMVWNMSQAGLHKDDYSPSHTGGPGDSGDVQLSPLLCRFIKVWEEKPRMGKSIWMGTL